MRSSLPGAACLIALCFSSAAAHAQTTINQTFTYTGNYQFFVVPTGVNSLFVRLWGAGGGDAGGSGGGGAFVSGNLSVMSGSTLTLLVGQGGSKPSNTVGLPSAYATFGGGGGADLGGTGGGRSGILNGSVELVDAGGGGGSNVAAPGGAGGVSAGASGSGGFGGGGGGGTQNAGGAGGKGNFNGSNGSAFKGGDGPDISFGGGGGGGYYGGGSGSDSGSGGGGSSYTSNQAFGFTLGANGSGVMAGGMNDALYINGVGTGGIFKSNNGIINTSGGNGEIVLSYTVVAVPEPGSVALLVGMGISGAGFLVRRRRRSRN